MKIKLIDPQKIILIKEKFLVAPYFSGKKIKIKNKEIAKEVDKFSDIYPSFKEGEIRLVFSEKNKIIFLNIGEKEKWSQRKFLLFLRNITRFLKENRANQGVILLENIIPQKTNLENLANQISENIFLADYEFVRYKEPPKEGWFKIDSIEFAFPEPQRFQRYLKEGKIIGKAVNFARDLANIPGGEMTPEILAREAKKAVLKNPNLKIEIFNKRRLEKLSMGGILGVARGSAEEPVLIILKYFGKPRNRKIDLAMVGKGVTFDSGGLQVKPSEAMADMHLDMSGGAAVLGAILAIAELKLSLNIIALIPAAENMPSGQSYRPGDLLKTYSGKTIEVKSTDAEGRIIMADALSFAVKNYKPKMVIDVATLTGAAAVALGQRATALFTNLQKLEKVFRQIGEDSGDYVWPLPCWEEYEEENKGTFGDIANIGKSGRLGGAITGALFLKSFVQNLPWVHLDIAPTTVSIEGQGLTKGATGTGVRYLIRLAQEFQKIKANFL